MGQGLVPRPRQARSRPVQSMANRTRELPGRKPVAMGHSESIQSFGVPLWSEENICCVKGPEVG